MTEKRICEAGACDNPAKYALYKTFPGGFRIWLNVCRECEQVIGEENEKRAMQRSRKAMGEIN